MPCWRPSPSTWVEDRQQNTEEQRSKLQSGLLTLGGRPLASSFFPHFLANGVDFGGVG